MKSVLVLFPPKTKNSADLYFRAGQIIASLRRTYQVNIEQSISPTGTTEKRPSLIVRTILLTMRMPSILSSIAVADYVVIFPSPFWYFFVPLAKMLGKPIVLDHFTTYMSHSDYIRMGFKVVRLMDKLIYRQLAAIMTHTRTMRRDLSRYYRIPQSRIFVLYSVVDTELFNPNNLSNQTRAETKKELGIPNDHKVAMYHGAYHLFHGTEVIEAAAKCLEGDKISIFLLGDPPPKVKVSSNLVYLAYVPFSALPRYIAIADVWLGRFTPTARGDRAASSCMFQAMAMAKPVITAHSQENDRILAQDKYGWLIEANNSNRLARIIRDVVLRPSAAEKRGRLARELIITKYNIEQVDIVVDKVFRHVEKFF